MSIASNDSTTFAGTHTDLATSDALIDWVEGVQKCLARLTVGPVAALEDGPLAA